MKNCAIPDNDYFKQNPKAVRLMYKIGIIHAYYDIKKAPNFRALGYYKQIAYDMGLFDSCWDTEPKMFYCFPDNYRSTTVKLRDRESDVFDALVYNFL